MSTNTNATTQSPSFLFSTPFERPPKSNSLTCLAFSSPLDADSWRCFKSIMFDSVRPISCRAGFRSLAIFARDSCMIGSFRTWSSTASPAIRRNVESWKCRSCIQVTAFLLTLVVMWNYESQVEPRGIDEG